MYVWNIFYQHPKRENESNTQYPNQSTIYVSSFRSKPGPANSVKVYNSIGSLIKAGEWGSQAC